ncbi:MAG: PP0621 family protein [Gammaproteobacteria bacterium]
MFSIRSLIVIILVALLVSLYSRLTAKNKGTLKQKQKRQQKPTKEIRETVKCAYCEVYLPEKDAIKQQGRHFCSEEHAHKFLQKPNKPS